MAVALKTIFSSNIDFSVSSFGQNLTERHDEALRFVDEFTYRIWHLHMARFRVLVLQRQTRSLSDSSRKIPGRTNYPALTRADWYE
jgi:hypothetical protein